MKRIEVGMLVMVIKVGNQRYVSDIGRVGTVMRIERNYRSGDKQRTPTGELMAVLDDETDTNILGELMGFSFDCLKPITPDSEPADADWQEDFKRMLDKVKVT